MQKQEFEQRIGLVITAEEYAAIKGARRVMAANNLKEAGE